MDDENQLLASEVARNLAALKDGRDGELRRLGETQVGLHSMLRQEAVRQRGRGREDRARALEARAASSLAVIERLEAERQRLRIVVPEVSEQGIRIDGRVRDPAGRGLPGLTLCLVDARNEALPGVPSPATDASGYYAFVLSPPDRTEQKLRAYLAVFSPKGRLLHREKQPLPLAAGTRLSVDVTLDPRQLAEGPKKPNGGQKPAAATGRGKGSSATPKRKRR